MRAGVSVGLRTVVAVDPKAKVFTPVTQSTRNVLRKMRFNYSSTNYNTAASTRVSYRRRVEKNTLKCQALLALGLKRVWLYIYCFVFFYLKGFVCVVYRTEKHFLSWTRMLLHLELQLPVADPAKAFKPKKKRKKPRYIPLTSDLPAWSRGCSQAGVQMSALCGWHMGLRGDQSQPRLSVAIFLKKNLSERGPKKKTFSSWWLRF